MKTKYIATSDFRDQGEVVKKGTILELNPDNQIEGARIATLNRAGRLLDYNEKNLSLIKEEIAQEAKREKRIAEMSQRPMAVAA